MALLLARLHTGNHDVLALRNAYHGMSLGTMGVTAHSTWKYNVPQARARAECVRACVRVRVVV